jgi:hypothetical protein
MKPAALALLLALPLSSCAPLVTEGSRAPTPPAPDATPTLAPTPAPVCASPPATTALSRGSAVVRPFACVEELVDPSGCPITRTTRSLDRAGRVVSERFEVLDPSRIEAVYVIVTDHLTTFAYDGTGRVVAERRDDGLDGSVDVVTRRVYDADGTLRLLEVTRSEGGDERHTARTEFNAQGLETLRLNTSGRYSDEVRNGYDAAGNPLWREERENGRLTARTAWTYAADGAPVARVRARGDGRTLDETRWRYDAAGRLEAREEGDLPNGALHLQRLRVTRFDAAGRAVWSGEDYPHDGVVDASTETTFDAAGRRLRERTRLGEQQTAETVWTYDVAGRMLTEDTVAPRNGVDVSVRYAPDGSAVSTTRQRAAARTSTFVRHLDAGGRTVFEAVDRDSDGAPESVWRSRYDAAGRPLLTESDHDGDGVVDARETWRYDPAGNLLTTRREPWRAEPREARSDYGCFGR